MKLCLVLENIFGETMIFIFFSWVFEAVTTAKPYADNHLNSSGNSEVTLCANSEAEAVAVDDQSSPKGLSFFLSLYWGGGFGMAF